MMPNATPPPRTSPLAGRPEDMVIMPGDLVHCDFGITYLRLNTDCQELAYVLKPGETEAPDFLKNGLKAGINSKTLKLKP